MSYRLKSIVGVSYDNPSLIPFFPIVLKLVHPLNITYYF